MVLPHNTRTVVIISEMHRTFALLQYTACVTDCSGALELDPGRVKAYFRRALAREQLGEDGDALRDAKRALEVCFDDICSLSLARCYDVDTGIGQGT